MKKSILLTGLLIFLSVIVVMVSCKKDEEKDVIASFTYSVDSTDFLKVTFTNRSSNFSALSWNFGDGSAVSTETNPVHTYAAAGAYNVVLTATSTDGKTTDDFPTTITLTDPNQELTKLVGEGDGGKVWKLIRVGTTGRFPIEVGPVDHSQIWWAMGNGNDEIANRACMLNDEWKFFRDGTMEYTAGGDFWKEGPNGGQVIFDPANICANTTDMIAASGEDCSAWGDGTHQFELNTGTNPTISAIGNGAFIGYYKVANDYEVYDLTPMVQSRIDYKLIKLTDGDVDTLIVEADYYDKPGDATYLGYWRHVLVHYDNPNDEPPIPGPKPVAGFTYVADGLNVTFTNTSTNATSYSWDFGDGGSSTEASPVHAYAGDGSYQVVLTATNANGDNTASQTIVLSSNVLTEDALVGGAWKLQLTGHAIYVGPGMGSDGWWICPLENLDGTKVGTVDDWSCMMDDEFIFAAGGGYEYKSNGGSRNDGYMDPDQNLKGCWSDAQIAASPGAPFGSCNTHTFTFTPATESSRAIIELTNGSGFAAFLGFMKGYYGGENTDGANPPNGGNSTNRYEVIAYAKDANKEVLIVSVDLTPEHSGGSSWTMELERSLPSLTEEILTAGAWKLQLTGHSIYVGPGMGSDGWWVCPLENLDGTKVGTVDDWSCMMDDEFIFTAGGGYEYKSNGGSRNDGYMDPDQNLKGCWTDAQIAASPGAPFGSCNTHTFTFTPASGSSRAIIELTNGSGYAAFIGFMKGFYGGENTDGDNPPNGGFTTNRYEVMSYANLGNKEVLVVTVDLTTDHSGGSAWTMELER